MIRIVDEGTVVVLEFTSNRKRPCYIYHSERGMQLVYNGPPPDTGFILTVENYLKWYCVYTIDKDGKVGYLDEKCFEWTPPPPDNYEHFGFIDHVPDPKWCKWFVETHPEYSWDDESLEMIYGRHFLEKCGYP